MLIYIWPLFYLGFKMKHKHAELIHAWAEGAEIERLSQGYGKTPMQGHWEPRSNPSWNTFDEYRIKPEPKPDVIEYRYGINGVTGVPIAHYKANVRLAFDSETGELKSVEMIK